MTPSRLGAVACAGLLALGVAACTRSPSAPSSAPPARPDAGDSASRAGTEPALCEHQVPADQCTKCSPELAAVFQELGDWCAEHGLPESHCRQCNPGLTFTAPAPRVVRLASEATARDVGIKTVRVAPRRFSRTLEVVGRLDFNQNRLAQLSARGDALILDVKVDVGDEVKAGQPLATLASGHVGSGQAQHAAAEARLKAARAAAQREEGLVQKGVSPRKHLETAQAELAAAEAELGAARAALGAAGAAPGAGGYYALSAPFAGSVVSRDAVAGRSAAAGQVLLQVADLATLWAQLDVPEAEAGLVRPGQRVVLTFEGARAPPLESSVSRVAASVDPATRTVAARVELPNPDRALKAGAFVRAKIHVAGEQDALLVPRAAVQRAEGQTLVFVQKGPGLYEPVAVAVGAEAGGLVEILSGLKAGAEVVTTGAFLLKTEVLKDSIGAGCCEEGSGE